MIEEKRPTTEIGLAKTEVEGSVSRRIERIAQYFPDQTAIVSDELNLTYAELNRAANQVAQVILEKLGEGSEPVLLIYSHNAWPIIALLGVLKTGKMYVILDLNNPASFSKQIVHVTQARLILADYSNLKLAEELAQQNAQVIDTQTLPLDGPARDIGLDISPETPACITFTSGSSGIPKGVIVNQRRLLHRAWFDHQEYGLGLSDRFSLLIPAVMSAANTDLMSTLLNGATLCLFKLRMEGSINLANWLRAQKITISHIPMAVFRQLLDILHDSESFPSLRIVSAGGDSLFKSDVEKFQRVFPESCRLFHRFSSSETTIVTRLWIDHSSKFADPVIPVGRVIQDKEVWILDEERRRLAPGEVGEIAVRSRYLASGYWGRPDLTQAKFLPDPQGGDQTVYLTEDLGRFRPDGMLEHLGRKDNQVKIRGFRVDTQSVEAVLSSLPQVKQAAVVVKKDALGETSLVAYVVPATTPAPTSMALRNALADRIPDYMIPARIIFLSEMPLTTNGKIDRKALPEQTVAPLHPALVPFQPLGDRLPFFCVHGLGGGVIGYELLAHLLGTEQPFYGVQARGVTGKEPPHTTFAEMAAYYIQAIQTIQPHGPYLLGGYCLGGRLAYEMACQLNQQGEPVTLLAILEGNAPAPAGGKAIKWQPEHWRNFFKNLPLWWKEYSQLGIRHAAKVARRKLVRAAKRALNRLGFHTKTKAEELVDQDVSQLPAYIQELIAAQSQAGRMYVPSRYPGKVTLFRVQRLSLFRSFDPEMGWGELAAGGVEIKMIEGSHTRILEQPNILSLAQQLKECLDNVQETRSSSSPLTLAMPQLEPDRALVPPQTPTEKALFNLWASVLERQDLSIYDNFFELGGNSLSAIHLISLVQNTWKLELSPAIFLELPTIAGLAEKIDRIT